MPHKGKLSVEEKVRAVRSILAGEISASEAARQLGAGQETVREWIAKYESEGIESFTSYEKNRVYNTELKLRAVAAYLAGEGSLLEICKKFKIRSTRQLRDWL